jgi:hypothetical protein
VVAVRVTSRSHGDIYLLTWGRIQDPVDSGPLERIVAAYASRSTDLRGSVERIEVCRSLQEASNAPYFFECLFEMAQTRKPRRGWRLLLWRRRISRRMAHGNEIWLLGLPWTLDLSRPE